MADIDKRLMQALSGRLGRGFLRTEVNHHIASALDYATDTKIHLSFNIWGPLHDLCIAFEDRNRDGGLHHG